MKTLTLSIEQVKTELRTPNCYMCEHVSKGGQIVLIGGNESQKNAVKELNSGMSAKSLRNAEMAFLGRHLKHADALPSRKS